MSLHRLIATWFGIGYLPPFPGTWGSVAGLILMWFIPNALMPFILLGLFFLGVWASQKFSEEIGNKDPLNVVVDEVLGMGVTLLFLPKSVILYIAAFFLFRFLDVKKLWWIRRLEAFPGGWGIMLDDLGAGIFGNIFIQFVILLFQLFHFGQ